MELALAAIIIYLIFCPPKYDPAIRFKEWMDTPSLRQKADDLTDETIAEHKRAYRESMSLLAPFKLKKDFDHE